MTGPHANRTPDQAQRDSPYAARDFGASATGTAPVAGALSVPGLPPGCDVLTAALHYAAAGWYVVPTVDPKNPGSLLGKGWQWQSSRDPAVIASWWQRWPSAGVALHVGRSGAVVLDVDHPEVMPDVLRAAVEACDPPHQSSRPEIAGRGHYLFAAAPGRFGNSLGGLGEGWGDVRGLNGIICAAPTVHAKAAEGAAYTWLRNGALPPIPEALADLLRPPGASHGTVDDAEVLDWLDALPDGAPCQAVARHLTELPDTNRYDTARDRAMALCRLGEQGHRGVRDALEWLQAEYVAAVEADREGGAGTAETEYTRQLSGAVAAMLAKPTPETDKRCCPTPTPDWMTAMFNAGGAVVRTSAATPVAQPPAMPTVAQIPAVSFAREITLTKASSIKPKRVRWTWDGRVPLGELSLCAGREGIGKTTMVYDTLARLTKGTLPGEFFGTGRNVVIVATEDSWEYTIVPRLMAAGAELDRVLKATATIGDVEIGLTLPVDVAALQVQLESVDAAVLVLDPLISRLGAQLDSHKDGEVRQALEPIVALAHDTGVAVLGIIHVNKSAGSDALNNVMASRAFTAVPRSVLYVLADPTDTTGERRIVAHAKNNLGRPAQMLAYTIEDATVATEDDGQAITAGRLAWAAHVPQTSLAALLTPEKVTALDRAVDWLQRLLESKGGWVASAYAKEHGEPAGHTMRTLQRAAKELGVEMRREGFQGATSWHLPTVAPPRAGDGTTGATGSSGESVCGATTTTPPKIQGQNTAESVAPVAPNAPTPPRAGATAEPTALDKLDGPNGCRRAGVCRDRGDVIPSGGCLWDKRNGQCVREATV
jgi:hypothetical protein